MHAALTNPSPQRFFKLFITDYLRSVKTKVLDLGLPGVVPLAYKNGELTVRVAHGGCTSPYKGKSRLFVRLLVSRAGGAFEQLGEDVAMPCGYNATTDVCAKSVHPGD